jgi:hypothetical protein
MLKKYQITKINPTPTRGKTNQSKRTDRGVLRAERVAGGFGGGAGLFEVEMDSVAGLAVATLPTTDGELME